MSLGKRLIKHTINFGLGSIVPKIIGFLLIPLYTIYLSPEDFGVIDLAMSFGAFLTIFMRFGVTGSVTRFFYDFDDQQQLKNYITTIFWILLAASLITAALVLLSYNYWLVHLIKGLPLIPFVVMVVLIGLFKTNSDLQRRLIQVREQSAYAAKLNAAVALITIGLTLFFVIVLKLNALGVILAYLISAIIFFLQAQVYLWKDLRGKISSTNLGKTFSYAVGIFPYHLINEAGPLINRSFLSAYVSLGAVGLFGIAFRFAAPLTLLTTAFQTAYLPIYFSIRKKDSEESTGELVQTIRSIWVIATIVFLGITVLGPVTVKLLTPEKFHAGADLLPYFGAIFLVQTLTVLYGIEIFYSRKTYFPPIISVFSIIANIVVVLLFIEQLEVVAVVMGLFIASVVNGILRISIAHYLYPLKKDYLFIIILGTFAIGVFVIFQFLIFPSLSNFFFQIGIGITGIGLYFLAIYLLGFINLHQLTLIRKKK